jgi:hypothetical protein
MFTSSGSLNFNVASFKPNRITAIGAATRPQSAIGAFRGGRQEHVKGDTKNHYRLFKSLSVSVIARNFNDVKIFLV